LILPTPAGGSYVTACNKSEKLTRTVHPSVSYGHLERPKDRSVYALSSGEGQRISILSAWAMDTDIFLLDERRHAAVKRNPAGSIDRRRPYPVIAVSATFSHIPFKTESFTMSIARDHGSETPSTISVTCFDVLTAWQ